MYPNTVVCDLLSVPGIKFGLRDTETQIYSGHIEKK